jgi:hypothetical protein
MKTAFDEKRTAQSKKFTRLGQHCLQRLLAFVDVSDIGNH